MEVFNESSRNYWGGRMHREGGVERYVVTNEVSHEHGGIHMCILV